MAAIFYRKSQKFDAVLTGNIDTFTVVRDQLRVLITKPDSVMSVPIADVAFPELIFIYAPFRKLAIIEYEPNKRICIAGNHSQLELIANAFDMIDTVFNSIELGPTFLDKYFDPSSRSIFFELF